MRTTRPTWYRLRGYRHLDRPIALDVAERLMASPEGIARHAFWPFIGYVKSTPRYKKAKRKVEKKARPIAYASHVDSLIFAYYCEQLASLYESELVARRLHDVVLAYRRFAEGKSNIDFAHEAFTEIAGRGPCEAVALDIEGFFDNLSHAELKRQWMGLLKASSLPEDHYAVFRAITAYTKVDRDRLAEALGIDPREGGPCEPLCDVSKFREVIRRDRTLLEPNKGGKGIPQGSPMSGLLANVYMLDVDSACSTQMAEIHGSYRRYSDDILIVCPPGLGDAALSFVEAQLKAAGLSLSIGKTLKSCFVRTGRRLQGSPPLQYLGFLFDGERRLVRSQTLARLQRKMIHAVRCAVRDAERSARRGRPAAVWRRDLYRRYSHLGKDRTYFRYYRRALAVMEDDALREQHRRLWRRLHELLDERWDGHRAKTAYAAGATGADATKPLPEPEAPTVV